MNYLYIYYYFHTVIISAAAVSFNELNSISFNLMNWRRKAGCPIHSAPLIIQFHSSFHLVSWNECEMDWFRWLHSPFAASIQLHFMNWMTCCALLSWIHWVEFNSCFVASPSRSCFRFTQHSLGVPFSHLLPSVRLHFIHYLLLSVQLIHSVLHQLVTSMFLISDCLYRFNPH